MAFCKIPPRHILRSGDLQATSCLISRGRRPSQVHAAHDLVTRCLHPYKHDMCTTPNSQNKNQEIWEFDPSRLLFSRGGFPRDKGKPSNFSTRGLSLIELLLREASIPQWRALNTRSIRRCGMQVNSGKVEVVFCGSTLIASYRGGPSLRWSNRPLSDPPFWGAQHSM